MYRQKYSRRRESLQMKANKQQERAVAVSASLATDAQEAAQSLAVPTADSWITNEVKTQIATGSVGKVADVGVTTTLGVLMLTGALASQDAVEHVKGVAGRVKDFRSVDVSGLTVAGT
jgi:hyperosmotically inducible protein